jgi:hypothetical protein
MNIYMKCDLTLYSMYSFHHSSLQIGCITGMAMTSQVFLLSFSQASDFHQFFCAYHTHFCYSIIMYVQQTTPLPKPCISHGHRALRRQVILAGVARVMQATISLLVIFALEMLLTTSYVVHVLTDILVSRFVRWCSWQ